MNDGTELPEFIKQKTLYKTKDLTEAAFIWSQPSVTMTGVETREFGPDPKNVSLFFKFEVPLAVQELEQLLVDYASRRAFVEPNDFAGHLRSLKALITTEYKKRSTINKG